MLTIDGTYDIECAEWDRFRCGEIYNRDGSRFVSWDPDAFYRELRSRKGHYWGHFAGRYDALWVLDRVFEYGDVPAMTPRGSGLLTLRIGKLHLHDSFAVWPDALSEIAPLVGAAKMKFPLPCECERACEGYCVLSRTLDARERRKVEEYLHTDCAVLLDVLIEVDARAREAGIDLRGTVGASAWATADAMLGIGPTTHDPGTYRATREGAFGGRSEVIRTRASGGSRNDRHASYPASLVTCELPVGGHVLHETAAAARSAWRRGRPGVYQARVRVPDCHLPPLPVREGERVLYPTGPLQGTWTRNRLEYAESCGVRIESIEGGITWPRAEAAMRPFAEWIWSLRDVALRDGRPSERAWAKLLKWIANSCTGKFGQRMEVEWYEYRARAGNLAPEADDADAVIRNTPHGALLAWEMERLSGCAHAEWYGYLTADAGIELHRQWLHADDVAGLVYGDTDSAIAEGELVRAMGEALGLWGREGGFRDFLALAPKLYRYWCVGPCKEGREGGQHPGSANGWHVRGKGMSRLTAEGFEALMRGETWMVDEGVRGLRDALRSDGPMFARKNLPRRHVGRAGWIGGRVLEADGVSTRATTVEEYRASLAA